MRNNLFLILDLSPSHNRTVSFHTIPLANVNLLIEVVPLLKPPLFNLPILNPSSSNIKMTNPASPSTQENAKQAFKGMRRIAGSSVPSLAPSPEVAKAHRGSMHAISARTTLVESWYVPFGYNGPYSPASSGPSIIVISPHARRSTSTVSRLRPCCDTKKRDGPWRVS